MKVSELFSDLDHYARPSGDPVVSSICFDSRKLEAGSVFVAIRGSAQNGHDFLETAARAGAVGLVVEDVNAVPRDFGGHVARTHDSRMALGRLAARFFGEPSRRLFSVGVTGTNGKTTTTHLIEAVFAARGWSTGVIGTIDHHLGSHRWPTELTTPDAVQFQSRLNEFVAYGADAAAVEASSHALDQRRVDDVAFDCAVFTNLTRDHLDYHPNLESYFAAKARLFTDLLAGSPKPSRWAIVNTDDAYGQKLREMLDALAVDAKASGSLAPTVWSFGTQLNADYGFEIVSSGFDGTTFRLRSPVGSREFRILLPGSHNVSNAVCAIAVGVAGGASLEQCAQGLASVSGVSGRLERIENSKSLHVFVDFAHTASALEGTLGFLNALRTPGVKRTRIVTVFGCGGDRDRGKRPLMLRAALAGSDFVVLTSDNPRGEDPLAIIDDALAGVPPNQTSGRVRVEPDRREAIRLGLSLAGPGDVVLIAGKGHEAYQQVGTSKIPFSDQETAREFLA